jgi:hypothetical protein
MPAGDILSGESAGTQLSTSTASPAACPRHCSTAYALQLIGISGCSNLADRAGFLHLLCPICPTCFNATMH